MSMPVAQKTADSLRNRTVKAKHLIYCVAVMRLGICVVNEFSLGELWTGICTLAVCMLVELICPACYSLLSLIVPVCLAAHAVFVHSNAMISLGQAVLFMPITVTLIGVPMSICLHRYFSHQAFATSRGVQLVLAILSTLAYQGGPLWWAVLHVRHHKNCDKTGDPHSLTRDGFWYSFLGWTLNPENYKRDYTSLPLTQRTSEIIVVQRVHMFFPVLACLVVKHELGYGCMLWCVLMPMLLSRIITCFFNLEFHPVDSKGICKGIDDGRVLAKLVGESFHKDHHSNPRRSRRKDWDLAWWCTLSWMKPLGLVWDCR